MRGVHQKAIKELMGHETLAMTDRYMHLSPVHLHDAANQFYVNALPVQPGMAFSVEPGIYLAGRCGARIEDIVVCTEDGVRTLNDGSRDLVVLPG